MTDTTHDDLAKKIASGALRVEWRDTESAARRVAEHAADRVAALTAERDALAEKLAKADRALSLTRRADDLREAYHRLPNDKNRIGDKRSKKSHARDAWLRAFRKAAKEARTTLAELTGGKDA